MDQALMDQAITLIASVLMTLLSWGAVELSKWIRAKRAKDGEDYIRDATLRLVNVAEIVVARGMAIQVKRARAAAEDGQITADEGRALLEAARSDVLDYLGSKWLADMERVIEPKKVRALVEDAIESAVDRYKKNGGSK